MVDESSNPVSVIVGLGSIGLSCAKYFASKGKRFKVVDSRDNPPGLLELKQQLPNVEFELGGFFLNTLKNASDLVVSPGVSLKTSFPPIAIRITSASRNDCLLISSLIFYIDHKKKKVLLLSNKYIQAKI